MTFGEKFTYVLATICVITAIIGLFVTEQLTGREFVILFVIAGILSGERDLVDAFSGAI